MTEEDKRNAPTLGKGFGAVDFRAIETERAIEDVKGNPFGTAPDFELTPRKGSVRDSHDDRHARVVGVRVSVGDGVQVDLNRSKFK